MTIHNVEGNTMENNEMIMETIENTNPVIPENPIIKDPVPTGKTIIVSVVAGAVGGAAVNGIKYLVKKAIKKVRSRKDENVVYEVDGQEVTIVDEDK